MRERGGVWIAHGAGTADRLVVDAADKCACRPSSPSYALRRLWLEEPTFSALLRRLRQRGPVAAVPPGRRAPAVSQRGLGRVPGRQRRASPRRSTPSSAHRDAPVFIQDYHLALVAPRAARAAADARTALFWHIPWPYPDRLRICPWRREILAGLLANDLLAFQLERDRRNFLLAAEEELDAEVEHGVVARPLRRPSHHGRVGADRRGLRPHSGDRRRSRRCRRAAAPARAARSARPTSSASASIGSTTPRASPSAWRRSTRC